MNTQGISFGEILKRERTKRNLSLRQLSEMSNIEASYIHRLEKMNRDNPGFTTVCALAKALELNADEILQSFGYDQLGTHRVSEESKLETMIKEYVTSTETANLSNIFATLEELRGTFQKENNPLHPVEI